MCSTLVKERSIPRDGMQFNGGGDDASEEKTKKRIYTHNNITILIGIVHMDLSV